MAGTHAESGEGERGEGTRLAPARVHSERTQGAPAIRQPPGTLEARPSGMPKECLAMYLSQYSKHVSSSTNCSESLSEGQPPASPGGGLPLAIALRFLWPEAVRGAHSLRNLTGLSTAIPPHLEQ